MSRKTQMRRSEAKGKVGDGPYREGEPKPEPALPEIVPAVTLIREGPEGYRVVLMHLPYEAVIEHSVHLFEPDAREMNDAQILGVFQRWREEGTL